MADEPNSRQRTSNTEIYVGMERLEGKIDLLTERILNLGETVRSQCENQDKINQTLEKKIELSAKSLDEKILHNAQSIKENSDFRLKNTFILILISSIVTTAVGGGIVALLGLI